VKAASSGRGRGFFVDAWRVVLIIRHPDQFVLGKSLYEGGFFTRALTFSSIIERKPARCLALTAAVVILDNNSRISDPHKTRAHGQTVAPRLPARFSPPTCAASHDSP
jgi:hypothetical protein